MRKPFSEDKIELIKDASGGDAIHAAYGVPTYLSTDIGSKLRMECDELRLDPLTGRAVPFRSDAERAYLGDMSADGTLADLLTKAMTRYAEYRLRETDAAAVDAVYEGIRTALSDNPQQAKLAIRELEKSVDNHFQGILGQGTEQTAIESAAEKLRGAGVQHNGVQSEPPEGKLHHVNARPKSREPGGGQNL